MDANASTLRLTDVNALKALSRRYGIRPSKAQSQNFLLDRTVLQRTVAAAHCGAGDHILEIGAGFGTLTEALLATGAEVTAFEIDERLSTALRDRFRQQPHLRLIVGDFFRWFRSLTTDLGRHAYSIVSNLPYRASSLFFETVLPSPHPPKTIIVLLQKEVAERIAAQPGSMSVLSLAVQIFGRPEILFHVPRTAFWPQPDVDSALLLVRQISPPAASPDGLFRLARMAFVQRRKQLHNSLQAGLRVTEKEVARILADCDLSPTIRPQELSCDQWWQLVRAVAQHEKKSKG
ncbi:MAG: 16S rRNA (adenine(1518)-N(6)/adenine(1519)-N(6))-dimethyltransferase RsmA [bacterium]